MGTITVTRFAVIDAKGHWLRQTKGFDYKQGKHDVFTPNPQYMRLFSVEKYALKYVKKGCSVVPLTFDIAI